MASSVSAAAAASSSSSEETRSASAGERSPSTSRSRAVPPSLNILHFDTGAGGDCTVFTSGNEILVIDGGRGDTGKRLTNHLLRLLETKTLTTFIVSHFDGDHYIGLFAALKGDLGRWLYENNRQLNIMTPLPGDLLMNEDYASENPDHNENIPAKCRSLRLETMAKSVEGEKVSFLKDVITFVSADSVQLGDWRFDLQPVTEIDATIAEGNNRSSLQWIVSHKPSSSSGANSTAATYYTGGDSLAGPIDATIVKLDHHGSDVGDNDLEHCNRAIRKSWAAEVYIIMGPGRGFSHPRLGLLDHLNIGSAPGQKKLYSTCHHFSDDDFDKLDTEVFKKGRSNYLWGDIGINLYTDGCYIINSTSDLIGYRVPFHSSSIYDTVDMDNWLDLTRRDERGDTPLDKNPRGATVVAASKPCWYVTEGNCDGAIELRNYYMDLVPQWCCNVHAGLYLKEVKEFKFLHPEAEEEEDVTSTTKPDPNAGSRRRGDREKRKARSPTPDAAIKSSSTAAASSSSAAASSTGYSQNIAKSIITNKGEEDFDSAASPNKSRKKKKHRTLKKLDSNPNISDSSSVTGVSTQPVNTAAASSSVTASTTAPTASSNYKPM